MRPAGKTQIIFGMLASQSEGLEVIELQKVCLSANTAVGAWVLAFAVVSRPNSI
jgi:hypothetical protein